MASINGGGITIITYNVIEMSKLAFENPETYELCKKLNIHDSLDLTGNVVSVNFDIDTELDKLEKFEDYLQDHCKTAFDVYRIRNKLNHIGYVYHYRPRTLGLCDEITVCSKMNPTEENIKIDIWDLRKIFKESKNNYLDYYKAMRKMIYIDNPVIPDLEDWTMFVEESY